VISFYFRLYLMLYACAARFDVTGNLKKLFEFRGKLNKAQSSDEGEKGSMAGQLCF